MSDYVNEYGEPKTPHTLVMRYTQTQEWRVPIGDSMGRAVETCIQQSGIAWGRDIDPTTIRFVIE